MEERENIQHGPYRQRLSEPPEDAQRASSTHTTKTEAQAAGREQAVKDRVEHLIHNKDGQIGQRNSYGNDPRPPKR